jgi:enterobactin synthetase component D
MCAVTPEPIPNSALERLHPSEWAHAASMAPHRRREWIAGRCCLAQALGRLAAPRTPLLTTRLGGPDVPVGFAGSISHKGPLTVAVATDRYRAVGLDLECAELRDLRLVSKILTARERMVLDSNSCPMRLARVVAFHFAVKEAVYKAADMEDDGGMDFHDIELNPDRSSSWPESAWTMQHIEVRTTSWCAPVAVLAERDWILAVAARL